jgi:AcrR family transcriptional regulator
MARRGNHTLEQIKEMVIEAAEELVVQGGLNQLRVRNIAVKIGYTVGSIYMVYENMNDLILHIKGRTLDAIVDEMDQVTGENPVIALEELANIYVNYANENLNRWSMVFEHQQQPNHDAPEWYRNKLDKLFSKFDAQFAALNPKLTASQRKQTVVSFFGGVHGICLFLLTTPIGGTNDKNLGLYVKHLVGHFTWQHNPDLTEKSLRLLSKERDKQNFQAAYSTAC